MSETIRLVPKNKGSMGWSPEECLEELLATCSAPDTLVQRVIILVSYEQNGEKKSKLYSSGHSYSTLIHQLLHTLHKLLHDTGE